MNFRVMIVLVLLVILADWIASFAHGQEPKRWENVFSAGASAPQKLPEGSGLRARPIGDILSPATPRPSGTPKIVDNAHWNASPHAKETIAVTSGVQSTAPASGSISQRLQAIRRSTANDTTPSAPAAGATPSTVPAANTAAIVPSTTTAPAKESSRTSSVPSGTTNLLQEAQELRPAGVSAPMANGLEAQSAPSGQENRMRPDATSGAPFSGAAAPGAQTEAVPFNGTSRRTRPMETANSATPLAETLLTSTGPQLRVETVGPRTMVLGKAAEYVVHVVNGGSVPATGIDVVIDLPVGLEVASANALQGTARAEKSSQGAAYLKWNVPQLEPGGRTQLNINAVATAPQPIDLRVEWACQSLVAAARIEVLEPKLELAINGPREVLYGEKKTYSVAVSNSGTGDLDNVAVMLPGANAERSLGMLKAGERREVQIDVVPRSAGAMNLTVEASGGALRTKALHEVLVRRAVLEVNMGGPQFSYSGSEGVYRATITNKGDAPAENVQATLNLPAGAQVVSASEGGKDTQAGKVAWSLGRIPPASSRNVELKCVISGDGESRLEMVATAGGDMVASHVAVTKVETIADLKLEISDPQGPIRVGDDVRYEIRISNRGTKAAQQVRVLAFFSNGVEPVSSEGGSGRIAPGQIQFDPIPTVGPGQKVVLKVVARAQKGGDHRFRAEVECGLPATQLAAEDTTRYYVPDNGTSPGSAPSAVIGTRPVPSTGGEFRR